MLLPKDDPTALTAIARQLLHELPHMVIGTADTKLSPWTVPVHQITLADGRITWMSHRQSRHSRNLAENPQMSATLYQLADGGEVSIFIEGTAAALEESSELTAVLAERDARTGRTSDVAKVTGASEFRIYVLAVTAAWMNDDSHTKIAVDLAGRS